MWLEEKLKISKKTFALAKSLEKGLEEDLRICALTSSKRKWLCSKSWLHRWRALLSLMSRLYPRWSSRILILVSLCHVPISKYYIDALSFNTEIMCSNIAVLCALSRAELQHWDNVFQHCWAVCLGPRYRCPLLEIMLRPSGFWGTAMFYIMKSRVSLFNFEMSHKMFLSNKTYPNIEAPLSDNEVHLYNMEVH